MRLQVHGISKSFGSCPALHDVHLEVAPGEIHALLGVSGAGKSTLLNVVGGMEKPDSGLLLLDCELLDADVRAARRKGVSMVGSEPVLAPHLSVEENLTLGCEPSWGGLMRFEEQSALARKALVDLHQEDIPLNATPACLPVAQQQWIAIARALIPKPRLLLMDDSARLLPRFDKRLLFTVLRQLAARGVAIVYATASFKESQELCDRYTVLRDGASVAAGAIPELSRLRAIELMAGGAANEVFPRFLHHRGKPVVELKALAGVGGSPRVDLSLRGGEIFGLAGLAGAGRTATLCALFGLEPLAGGQILLGGKRVSFTRSRDSMRAGIGLAGKDSVGEALMRNQSIADNLTMADLAEFGRFGWIFRDRQQMAALDWMEKLHITAFAPIQEVGDLPAGDRQKVALGRLLYHRARILLLDEPTRGMHWSSKREIYKLMGETASEGRAIVFTSSWLPELLGICDTIGVMRQGVLVATRPAAQWKEDEIMEAAGA